MQIAVRLGALVAVSVLWLIDHPSLTADELAHSAASAGSAAALTAREQLYAELAIDVAELEQRGSILKRVVKLVTPAVVHIEAKRDAEATRPARGEAEEAGSGVIIERRGKLYV